MELLELIQEQKMKDENNINNEIQGKYANEMQELINIANNKFGSDYFDKLEELTKDYSQESEPDNYRYSLKINNIGAFNAC
jgi:hypothetical protein